MVEEIIILNIDKELGSGGVRFHGAGHGHRTEIVLQAIVRLVFNRFPCGLLLHIGVKATALNHEVIDHAMENGAIVVAFTGVVQKVFDGFGRLLGIQFQFDFAESRADDDHAVFPAVMYKNRAMIRAFEGQENRRRAKRARIVRLSVRGCSNCYKPGLSVAIIRAL